MNAKIPVLILISLAILAIAAGCTSATPPSATPQPAPVATVTVADAQACTTYTDCVPAQCCHPAGCTAKANAPVCGGIACTGSCEGPIDCGAGSCGCVSGRCTVMRASSQQEATLTVIASPQRYSPMMSSTPGIALTPRLTGYVPDKTSPGQSISDFSWDPVNYEWNATFGEFLAWDAPDYTVHRLGNPVATGEKPIYWTFSDPPADTKNPVVITVTARDMTRQGAEIGTSTVTLNWDKKTAVYVGTIT